MTASASEDRDDGDDQDLGSDRGRGRGRRKKKKGLAGEMYNEKKVEDDEAMPSVSVPKQVQLSVGLLEINRKLVCVNPVF